MTWADAGGWIFDHLATMGKALGLGGGVGALKYVRHIPAPLLSRTKWGRFVGSLFDWAQDMTSNNDRVGERINDQGETIFLEPVKKPKEPAQ